MFVHHVFFYMAADASETDKATLKSGIESLTAIASIRQWHLGVPAATNRAVIDTSYAFSWLTLFDDAAGEAAYQVDPLHLTFIEEHKHLWVNVKIYDSL
jgi:Stress responsive A/B Barrel Domain